MKEKFKELLKSDKLNTSYPIRKEDWQSFKSNKKLEFKLKDMCFYIHIPFCLSKCKFCEYIKYTKTDEGTERKYIDILIKDITNFINEHSDINLYGIDVGGGTPTCLSDNNFKILMDYLKENVFTLNQNDLFEPSIESTFNSITENKIKLISNCGFKRISFGIQTVNEKYLKNNDRVCPTLEKINQTFLWCEKYNIKKINIDLMYGLNGQSKKDLKNNVKLIKYLMPSQVTLYEMRTNILSIKEYKSKKQLFNQYKYLFKQIKKLGYFGSFGQNTFSLDNQDVGLSSYLKNRMIKFMNYKGFGISAQSKADNGIAYNLGKTPMDLIECLNIGSFDYEDVYILPKEEMLAKYVAVSGYYGKFDIDIMSQILNEDSYNYFKKEIEFLQRNKYIKLENRNIIITSKGFKYYGAILAMFYPEKNNTN